MRLAVYAVVVPLLALGLAPVLYQAGKVMVEVSEGRETNFLVEWLAPLAAGVEFHEIFVLMLLGLAVVLLLPLYDVTGGRLFRGIGMGAGMWRGGVVFLVTALAGVLAGAGMLISETRGISDDFGIVLLLRALAVGLLGALAFEWFFRGVLFGALGRVWPPVGVVLVTALVFTLFRLLLLPMHGGFNFVSRESWGLGWEMLGMLLARSLEPAGFAAVVLPVFGWGVVLGVARLRTGGIWLPFCMHAGWLCVDRVFAMGSTFSGRDPAWICWCALGASVLIWALMKSEPEPNDD